MSGKDKDVKAKAKDKENLKTAKHASNKDKNACETAKTAEKVQEECSCGDNCDCTPKDNCGCSGKHNHEDCGCNHDHQHSEGCGCGGHGKRHNQEEEYAAVFAQLQHALEEGEKQLKKARDDAIDNQRLAVTYKKDLERYKERTANIQTEAIQNATEQVATGLLPILDQFESALKIAPQTSETQGFYMIFSSLKNLLTNMGVQEMEALGQPFDSNIHNAVSRQKVTDKSKDGVVTAVYQRGYQIKSTGKILRYAMVEIGEYNK